MDFENGNVKLTVEGDTLFAYISGEIDHHSAKSVRESIDTALVSYSPDVLIMDVSGITFMDSSGLGLVLGRYTKTSEAGIGFFVTGVGERIEKMFDMAGLYRIIDYKEQKDEKNM
ncbi:MAG: STAS domain-containing protein [Ruminococcaceae bacterium]|nr:STAS domain-containing protein [Oscillospiraceae bacterium]